MCQTQRDRRRVLVAGLWALGLFATCGNLMGAAPGRDARSSMVAGNDDRQDDSSPWSLASGSQWLRDYPTFNPLLEKARVRWLDAFYEWQTIQPQPGEWQFDLPDALVASCRSNHLHLAGNLAFFTHWSSADGGTRKGPIKDMQYWRDYVRGVVARYHQDIKHWEVWHEFNSSSAKEGEPQPQDYGDLVCAAWDAARQVDPESQIGLSIGNFDVGFIDRVIKAGASNHFDYIFFHAHENLGAALDSGDVGLLNLAGNLRKILATNQQRVDIPLWISTDSGTAIVPDAQADSDQAAALIKAYVLSLAAGFQRVSWFEARGPTYGGGMDHGIIRPDWTRRPAYDALQTMIRLLGQRPRYAGWLDVDHGAYGFIFHDVLVTWSPAGQTHRMKFDAPVRVIDLAGQEITRQELILPATGTPVFITGLPAALLAEAQANAGKPVPWGSDVARAQVISCRLGAPNVESGLKQIRVQTTVPVVTATASWRRPDFAVPVHEGHYIYFQVDPQFVHYGTTSLAITAIVQRAAPGRKAGMSLDYESLSGYRGARDWLDLPQDDAWHELTWNVDDANFVGHWDWHFRINALQSAGEFWIKEVRVRKITEK